jgi:hypothetical protein
MLETYNKIKNYNDKFGNSIAGLLELRCLKCFGPCASFCVVLLLYEFDLATG